MKEGKREQMPVTAWLVDELRRQWGVAATDALLRRSMKGDTSRQGGAFYVAELGHDGQVHEFGATIGGRRCVAVEQQLTWVDAAGHALPPVTWYTPARAPRGTQGGYPLHGSSRHPPARVIRASIAAQLQDSSKGVVR